MHFQKRFITTGLTWIIKLDKFMSFTMLSLKMSDKQLYEYIKQRLSDKTCVKFLCNFRAVG